MITLLLGIHLGEAQLHDSYDNPYFLLKISGLVCAFNHAVVFRKSVYRNPKALDSPAGPPAAAKVAATLSLVIWVSILSCGRMIAYWDNPNDQPGKAPIFHGQGSKGAPK